MTKKNPIEQLIPLLKSFELGHLTLKNRIAVAPMTRISATDDGKATEEMVRYYARFARGVLV